MKRLIVISLSIGIVLVGFVFNSCNNLKKNTNSIKKDSLTCSPMVLDTAGTYVNSDPFLLVGAELKGKCLEIEVEYSGGCGGDVWTLAWNGMLMKSLPPKANIYLHLKDEDACREVVRKKISFDISSIYNNMEVVLFLKDFRGELVYKP